MNQNVEPGKPALVIRIASAIGGTLIGVSVAVATVYFMAMSLPNRKELTPALFIFAAILGSTAGILSARLFRRV